MRSLRDDFESHILQSPFLPLLSSSFHSFRDDHDGYVLDSRHNNVDDDRNGDDDFDEVRDDSDVDIIDDGNDDLNFAATDGLSVSIRLYICVGCR